MRDGHLVHEGRGEWLPLGKKPEETMKTWSLVVVAGVLVGIGCGGGAAPGTLQDVTPTGQEVAEGRADILADREDLDNVFAGAEDIGSDGSPETGDQGDIGAEIQPGMPGWPCEDGKECYSGYCIETPDGYRCTRLCSGESDCEPGYKCLQVATYPDVVFACVHPAPRECRPCRTDEDCAVQFAGTPMVCAGLGGYYGCLRRCEAGCASGQECLPVGGVGARTAEACVPSSGVCECTQKSVTDGAVGLCEVANEAGVCRGEYRCTEEGFGTCSASAPRAEECNGLDDDCDGATDEGVASAPCEVTNEYGTCPGGQTACEDGHSVCVGKEPGPEVCNGSDEDCDGQADEGFSDADADGVADCVDEDRDGDGVSNAADNCAGDWNPDQADLDEDGDGDVCDADDDGDGVPDAADNCARVKNPDQKDQDGDAQGDACDCDVDGDGVGNGNPGCPECAPCDNCASVSNPDQADCDADGQGDACDADDDNDGVPSALDNCRCWPNPDQADLDHDAQGDVCDADDDGDGVEDAQDNCPSVANPAQADQDADGQGDACDCDADGDGVANENPGCPACEPCDNCAGTPNADQVDANHNGVGDACEDDWDGDGVLNDDDNCPWVSNPGQEDLDLDGVGDACDCDVDGDGVFNANPGCPPVEPADNCPQVVNPDQADLDGDQMGDACDADWDGDGDANETDCAPRDGSVFHGQVESCNGLDDDCDAETDEEDADGCVFYFWDEDADGYGVTLQKCLCGPSDAYQALRAGDCNDLDPEVNPGMVEVCGNGKDDNCNGSENDEGATGCVNFYEDLDLDGWGTGAGKCLCYSQGDLTAKKVGDCDDQDPARNPGLDEKCLDQKDNDCDGQTDESGCAGCKTYYRDEDQDGYGVTADKQCIGAAEYPYTAVVGGDCDDANANVKPGAFETCNDLDDNCDGATDPIGTQGCQLLYPDADADGYGALNQPAVCHCKPTGIYRATVSGDCVDSDAGVNPQATEVCDGTDNNCNGQVDEGVLQTYFKDADADGYGLAGDSKSLCAPQAPYKIGRAHV